MTLYARKPARMALQLTGDLLLLAWTVAWAWVGRTVHDLTAELARPGLATASAADDIAARFHDVEGTIQGVPAVGDELAAPFGGAATAAMAVADAGRAQAETVTDVAFWLGLAVFLLPVLLVAVLYVPLRVNFVRRAAAARRLAGSDPALLALRAMSHLPLRTLARVSDDPVAAWRDDDTEVVRELANLELDRLGLPRPRKEAPRPALQSVR
ncbi:hypothetical protein ATJ88_0260 [Isoptericola jiangsuensis]|uniref:Transmembrane protein n=1 Tax=Isoptericola jiangsuensis TaxID=548579 RepID=A0A2A9ERW8_9MICO|nr:hypothetical protein [Isoptericola jiangsuensis]PFG41618.1 hypothetical protein ATJ88_0260 [Isoptericola jiangsuensis]